MLDHKSVHDAERDKKSLRPFIKTYKGNRFFYDNVRGNSIDIEDIAHALSHLGRFTGHTTEFWSVAQHSLLVAEKMPGIPEEKLVALLHDAAEAYTGDLASPLKAYLKSRSNHVYGGLQDTITAAIYNRYGVTEIPSDVRLYDRAACLFEAEGFMGLSSGDLERDGFPVDLRELWQPWEPVEFAEKNGDVECVYIETLFLERFRELMNDCNRGYLL